MPDIARRVLVRGHVQGVFFRASTRDLAISLGVAGWVRNDPGGTVSALVQGDATDVQRVLDWMRGGGPPQAHVADLDVEEAAVDPTLTSFRVVR